MFKKAPICIFMAFLFCFTLQIPTSAQAESDTAYLVASDDVFNTVTGIRGYLEADDVTVIHVNASELGKLKDAERYLVFGNPDADDAIGKLIRKNLTNDELSNARRMGKAQMAQTTIDGKETMIFATTFSVRGLVKSSAGSWKELFESWYGITIPITQIIGY